MLESLNKHTTSRAGLLLRRRWLSWMGVLSCLMALAMASALVLPAAAMGNEPPAPEHDVVMPDEQADERAPEAPAPAAPVVAEGAAAGSLSADAARYALRVSYGPEAGIPEGSALSMVELAQGSGEFERARDAVLADRAAQGEPLDEGTLGLAALDISIIGPDGQEVEPDAPVRVELTVKSLPGVDDLGAIAGSIAIQHHVETGDGIVVEEVFGGGDAAAADADAASGSDGGRVDAGGLIASFETDTFSTYTISWAYGSYNIHYVATDGSSLTPTMTPTFTNGTMFLIYDIEGYEYDSTHYGSMTGTAIAPLLRNTLNDRQFYQNGWRFLRDDIYVVYREQARPTPGGQVVLDPEAESWPTEAPTFSKSSTNNGDGTNTISLSITAAEKEVESRSKANVIVVFDVSRSMNETLSGTSSRLEAGKAAVNELANTLLSKTDGQGNKLVKMALISFSTTATTVQGFTDNYTTFSGKVSGLTADGGTNWEQALALANRMEVDSDAATYLVFVTDGDPTFRMSRGPIADAALDMYTDTSYQYYRSDHVFGTGSGDDQGRNFDAAAAEVRSIVEEDKNFYAIGVSSDVTKVRTLMTSGGAPEDNAFLVTNTAGLTSAFDAIASSINTTLGFGGVEITDGVTELTNMSMKVMHAVDEGSFQYFRYGGEGNKYGADYGHRTEWTTREADGCAAASYNSESGAVEWNMGAGFQLEDSVSYVVTFRVWPSQEAFDLVADLNNGIRAYGSLTEGEQAQVVELEPPTQDGPGSYALKTNTEKVEATYRTTSRTGETVTASGEEDLRATYHEGTIENMPLASERLTIRKLFEDDLTLGEDRDTSVTLVLKRREANSGAGVGFEDYPVPQGGGVLSPSIVLNDGNGWSYSLYVAPGLKVGGEVLDHGYDFTITEPDIDYHYELIEEIINPMVVDGAIQWLGDVDGNKTLSAINRVKSGIDITKRVLDANGNEIYPETEFTIVGKLLDKDGKPFTWAEGDGADATGAYHKYDRNGNRLIYKGHFASSDDIAFTLKAGESLRFINVPEGCSFEFLEQVPATYEQDYGLEAIAEHRVGVGGEFSTEGDVQPRVENGVASLDDPGVVGNKRYALTFSNRPHPSNITIKKVDRDDGRSLDGASFDLFQWGKATDGTEFAWNRVSSLSVPSAGYVAEGLVPGVRYKLSETRAPSGYALMTGDVYFTLAPSGSGGVAVLLTDEAGAPLEGSELAVAEGLELVIKNTKGQSLPLTGGPGVLPYALGGLSLVATSLGCGYGVRRRSERRGA